MIDPATRASSPSPSSSMTSKNEHLLTTMPTTSSATCCGGLFYVTRKPTRKCMWVTIAICVLLVIAAIVMGLIAKFVIIGDSSDDTPSKSLFLLAAVQYYPFGVDAPLPLPNVTLSQNLQAYEEIVQQLYLSYNSTYDMKQVASIAVFPEAGLGYLEAQLLGDDRDAMQAFCEVVPNAGDNVIPCDIPSYAQTSPQLYRLSCLARKYDITLVVNMCEIRYCQNTTNDECPEDGRFQFDENVVFGPSGAVVSKYSKSHIWDETLFDQPEVPAIVTFPIDQLGIDVGTIVCFDIEYHAPLALLSQQTKYLAFTSWWATHQPPMLTAPMIQQAASYVVDMTIIAGNALNLIAAGGGIFKSGEILGLHWNSTYSQTPGARDIVSTVVNMSDAKVSRSPPSFQDNIKADIQSLKSLLTEIEVASSTNINDADQGVPCSVASIGLPGVCQFAKSVSGPQFFNISLNGVRCVANITFDLLPGFDNVTNYALFATNYNYPIPATTDLLTMQSCFLLRCESTSTDPTQPISCNTNVYKADAYVDSVDIYGAYNCSEFWNPPADGSNLPLGRVLPMVAVNDAHPVNSSVFTHSRIGCVNDPTAADAMTCGQYDQCWFRMQVPQPIADPVWSVGMYGVNGKAGF